MALRRDKWVTPMLDARDLVGQDVTVRVILDASVERSLMVNAIKNSAVDGQVRVLEAGCGSKWGLVPSGVDLHITGIDLDPEALRIRQETRGDLQVAIVADLHDVDLPESAFDVAYCSYVLEHVDNAEAVLDRLINSVRPGGRLILRVPDGRSVFGWVAKHTPHPTHVWFKKYVERFPDAGKPGHAPYPTVYEPIVSVNGLERWADRRDLKIEDQYATNYFIRKFGKAAPVAQFGLNAVSAISRGKLTSKWNNIGFVFVRSTA